MKRLAMILSCLWLATAAMAASAVDRWHGIQASMVVTGTITVGPEGSVEGYTLYEQDKLPPGVVQIVQRTIKGWQFVPIIHDGNAVTAKSGMSLRIMADMIDRTHATIRVAGAEFGCDAGQARKLLPAACPEGASVHYRYRRPPTYPIAALRGGVGGEVFLVLEIGRDGRVTRAAARQVNLYARVGNADFFRKVLADSASKAAMNWQFQVPTVGPQSVKDHWVVQVPVNYMIARDAPHRDAYGRWNAYLPGPAQTVPWGDEHTSGASRGSADAIADGAPFLRDPRFVLKSPLDSAGRGS